MEEKRRFSRFPSQLKARYFVKEEERSWEDCTIINISRKGMSIKFLARGKINVDSIIHLEVFVPTEIEPIIVEGVLKWFEQLKEGNSIGGIELKEVLAEDKFAGLFSAYTGKDITN